MKITLVTPAAPRSRAGNRATATRWARLLGGLGHRVRIAEDWQPGDPVPELLLALHAWRSAGAIGRFAAAEPMRPLVVVLTGTDIYRFQHSHPEETLASLERAHALIGLHARVAEDIPARFRGRLHNVLQSAPPLPASYRGPAAGRFEVCVIGHLREEKDSLRAAYAARRLPAASRLRVTQAGRAHSEDWAEAARAEMSLNPRYRWLGEIPHGEVRRLLARSRAMVMSSVMEGGANAVSEACVAGLPVLASEIPGNTGLLGADYPGYYPPQDTAALASLLERSERDPAFLDRLRQHCAALAPRFTPAAEQAALARVLATVTG